MAGVVSLPQSGVEGLPEWPLPNLINMAKISKVGANSLLAKSDNLSQYIFVTLAVAAKPTNHCKNKKVGLF